MVAYSFNRQFVAAIIEGTKRQTIRPVGKRRHATPGCRLQLYTAMRTKHCRAIGQATCASVARIELRWRDRTASLREGDGSFTLVLPDGFDDFARADGFISGTSLAAFWDKTHGLVAYPFAGVLVRWCDFEVAA